MPYSSLKSDAYINFLLQIIDERFGLVRLGGIVVANGTGTGGIDLTNGLGTGGSDFAGCEGGGGVGGVGAGVGASNG